MKTPIITLSTDFGRRDPYSGAMKGVILGICPRAAVVDLSHEIGPGDIREAALLVSACAPFFPRGSIHVVVVDPGVGSARKIICAKTSSAYFIAPDNGVLTAVLSGKSAVIREVSNPAFFRKKISATFHGRDKFAPAAAHLAAKDIFAKMGPRLRTVRTLEWPVPAVRKKRIAGEVLHVDRFGNLITNIGADLLRNFELPPADIRVGRKKISFWGTCYAEGMKGRPMALCDSQDRVEIAVSHGSAAARLGASAGTPVTLEWK
jgi:S-adenosylmethionine hydrolase